MHGTFLGVLNGDGLRKPVAGRGVMRAVECEVAERRRSPLGQSTMRESWQDASVASEYSSVARNFSAESENRIHDESVAQRFGFEGGLVPGAAVFGHMTHPLIEAMGEDWASGHRGEVRFLKPAYDGDELLIRHLVAGDNHLVQCLARGDTLLSELRTGAWNEAPEAAPGVGIPTAERPEICWDNIHVGEPFPAFGWQPTVVENAEFTAEVADDLDIYANGFVHPHGWLNIANRALTRRYHLPAWMHVGSDFRLHAPIRVGDAVDVRAVPTNKWRRKGHEFLDLTLAFVVQDAVAMEIRHTAIFAIAPRRP